MSDYPSYRVRPISAIGFFVGTILIVAILLLSVYYGRKYVLSVQKPNHNTEASKRLNQKQDKTKEEVSKEEKKEADEAAAKAAEEKKKQQSEATIAAEQQAQASAATNPANPSHVASTGPEDTALMVLGVFALSYAGYRLYDSRSSGRIKDR